MHNNQRITDLPHEILQDIFHNVVSYADSRPTDHTEIYRWQSFTSRISTAPHTPSYRSSASPYSITHVSRQWRIIALNHPHLWTHLRVMKPEKPVILKVWIDRARSLPLHLSLFQQHSEDWNTMKDVLCLFLSSIHRCVSLTMYLKPSIEESFAFLTALDVQYPTLLETVGIFSYRHASRQVMGDNALANLILCSPKIRWITWSQSRSDQFNVRDHVLQCWGNLRVLKLDSSQEARSIIHILSHCPNLEVFIATTPIKDSTDPQGITPLILTRLMKWAVPAIANSSSEIFKWLTLPSLVELEIDVYITAEWDLVADMLERSGACLRVLNVSGDSFDEVAFLPVLTRPCFVELKELYMAHSPFQHTLQFLGAYSGLGSNDGEEQIQESRFMPHLEKIVLRGIDFHPGDYEDDEDPFTVFSALAKKMAKSRLGMCDSETVHQYLDINFLDEMDRRVSLTIPPVAARR